MPRQIPSITVAVTPKIVTDFMGKLSLLLVFRNHTGVMKEIPRSVKNQENRELFFIFLFFYFFIFLFFYFFTFFIFLFFYFFIFLFFYFFIFLFFYFFIFLFFYFFYNLVFVVKVQETAWSASYGVNKTINNPTSRFTPSWEKSNPSKPEPILPPRST